MASATSSFARSVFPGRDLVLPRSIEIELRIRWRR